MLLRRLDDARVVAISQPHHAWISGELARAWGNEVFALPEPREAVICGTALHDIGWLDWEARPRLDPLTGLPMRFPRVQAEEHAPMWRRGVTLTAVYGALPALLVSRHGVSIYERFFDAAKARPEAVAAVGGFLDWQRGFEAKTIARLASDPATAAAVGAANLAFTKSFVAALDAMSLHLCWGVSDAVTLADVPIRLGTSVAFTLRRAGEAIAVDPWPFATGQVEIAVEGRLLDGRCVDQAALDLALGDARVMRIATRLVPGSA